MKALVIENTNLYVAGYFTNIGGLPRAGRTVRVIDMDRLRQELGEPEIELATEDEIEQLFADCERGAMPPFGSKGSAPTASRFSSRINELGDRGPSHDPSVASKASMIEAWRFL